MWKRQLRQVQVDTARVYTGGTSEEYLGKLDWQSKGLIVETKLYPSAGIKHTPEVSAFVFHMRLSSHGRAGYQGAS